MSSSSKLIEEAFNAAIQLDPDARNAYAAAFGDRHPHLAERLRRLLRADGAGDEFLTKPIEDSIASVEAASADPWIGRILDVWTIRKRIGVGGMGAVFLAERTDDQYAQVAAIKIMGAQLLDQNAVARFRAERQILANLNHPNIATLIGGGSTGAGLPYLVMEFVDGERVDAYCDSRNLGIRERILLFAKICDVVDYAHRNLVVHRDLKPSNIFVTPGGEPKLLDFGIAKLLEPGAYDATVAQTGAGARMMTPEYASPEQVRGEAVSVATDVYALGVLLFRLLTGQSPYGATVTSPRDIESAILQSDPRRPSTVVSDTAASSTTGQAEELSARRSTSPARLRQNLFGDLDNIVLKCLQKAPERRYATARELSADLARYLSHQPVLARGDGWPYRARKFAVRHARALAASGIVAVSVIAVVMFYTWRLAGERDRAAFAAAKAEQVSAFLTDVFRNADPHTAQGTPATAIDLLDEADRRTADLSDQPMLQAELMQIIGDTYTNLGRADRSVGLLEQSLKMREQALSGDPLTLAALLLDLAEAHRLNNSLEAAEGYMRRALDLRRRALPSGDDRVVEALARLGVVLSDQRRKAEALEVLRRARAEKQKGTGSDDSLYVDIVGNMAHLLTDLGEFEEAQQVHAETIRLSEEIDGPLHPNTAIRYANLGLLEEKLYRFDDALRAFSEAVSKSKQIFPEDHPFIAQWTGNVAQTLGNLGRFDEALNEHDVALALARRSDGEESGLYTTRLRYRGVTLLDQGRLKDAERDLDRVLALATGLPSNSEAALDKARSVLARLRNLQNRPAEAEAYLRQVLRVGNTMTKPDEMTARRELATSLSLQGRKDEAAQLFEEVIAEAQESFGADGAPLMSPLIAAAVHFRRSGDPDRAVRYAQDANRIAQATQPPGSWLGALAAAELAFSLRATGRVADARPLAESAHAVFTATLGASDARTVALARLLNP